MSDSPANTNMESQNVPGWTLVNSQGEIMSGDDDSESSESSIEVVSLVDNVAVSHRLQRERSSEQVDVVVPEATNDNATEETIFNLEDVAGTEKAEFSSASDETGSLQEATLYSDFHRAEAEISDANLVKTDSTLSGSTNNFDGISVSTNPVFQEQKENCLGDGLTVQCTEESQSAVACEMSIASCETDFDQTPIERNDEIAAVEYLLQVKTEDNKELLILDTTENLHQISLGIELEESKRHGAIEAGSSACCSKLLLESGEPHHADLLGAADAKGQQIPAPVSFEEANISQVSDEGATESSHSSRSDSDADSDFVRLDSENIDGYVGQHQNNGERVVIPLRLYRTDSSIGPNFSFMRSDERNDNISQNEGSFEVVDHDRDDDTESSTEEGIDDRIESEQSEAGSLSALNDIGDLSVFADIGDLPLVAGDVPRNYIHRPNNHLSTVLNIIVVLVAILTMGISLGIIMATDLEIEEWQNAHEFQTRRVSQLEILLKSKTNAYELQLSRVKELEPQLIEIRNNIRLLEKRAKNYERAFETLAAHSSKEGETFEKVLHTILDGVKVYVQCQEESSQLVAVDCHLKLLPYLRSYTALIKNDLSKNMDLDVSLGKSSLDNVDVDGMSTQDTTEDTLSLAISDSNIEISIYDSQELGDEELSHLSKETTENDAENRHLDLEAGNYGEADSQESDNLQGSSESDDRCEDKTSASSFAHSEPRIEQKTPKEIIRALPIAIDIRQLQQSLTREQERALHWQQLYLSERRQRERERENEELEDEREREIAEREREQMIHVECLRKLMSANLTTLTQHVVKWNVSVFDDFANLSVLLSGISDLQQAVVDSVQRVWKSAEEVIDSLQGKDSVREETTENGVPKKEMVIEYLSQLADQIKRVDMPDHEALVDYLGKMLDHVKHGVEDILHEVYTESVSDSVYKMWENAHDVINNFNSHKEMTADGEKVGSPMPDREHLLAYLSKVMEDICPKDNSAFKAHSIKLDKDLHENENKGPDVFNPLKDKISEDKVFDGTSPAGPHVETISSHPHLKEEESSHKGFWSRKIGKMLKKTGKSVRKLGRKVAGTWEKIKTMWREKKPLWHKLKNMWHEKKTVFFNAGDRFASTVKKASSKFANMCTKMSKNWFKTRKSAEVDINTKCVHKLRQHWQKMILKDPCHIVGKFSYECNSGKKQCKKDLHKMSNSFYHLMKIPNLRHDQFLKVKINELKVYHKQFKSFLDQWGKRKLLLKTDIGWVNCQEAWWSAAITAAKHGYTDELDENKCNIINLADNFYDGQQGAAFDPGFSCDAKNSEKYVDLTDDEITDFHTQQSRFISPIQNDDYLVVEEDENNPKSGGELEGSILNSDEAEINETVSVNDDSLDWYHKQLQQGKHLREEKASWVLEHAKAREQLRNKQHIDVNQDNHNKIHQGNWMFKKARGREQQRAESGKSFWLFERANQRRDHFHHKWIDDHQNTDHKRDARKSGDWFMKQAEERLKIRKEEHKSDWLFERAADRKKGRDDKHKSNFRNHDSRKPEQFRHVYGKVSTP